MSYKPYTLPPLPRRQCPYEIIYQTNDNYIKARPCRRPALAGGWCNDHSYVQIILELAEAIGCPAMVIVYVQDRPALTVGRGLAAWEAYAVRHPLSRHKALISKLQAAKAELDAENKKARIAARETARRRAAEVGAAVA